MWIKWTDSNQLSRTYIIYFCFSKKKSLDPLPFLFLVVENRWTRICSHVSCCFSSELQIIFIMYWNGTTLNGTYSSHVMLHHLDVVSLWGESNILDSVLDGIQSVHFIHISLYRRLLGHIYSWHANVGIYCWCSTFITHSVPKTLKFKFLCHLFNCFM